MYNKRITVYCCLNRIQLCKKRIEASQPRRRIGSETVWLYFEDYVGINNVGLFDPLHDVICQTCSSKIRAQNPLRRLKKSKPQIPLQLSPKKLRSEKHYDLEIDNEKNHESERLCSSTYENMELDDVNLVPEQNVQLSITTADVEVDFNTDLFSSPEFGFDTPDRSYLRSAMPSQDMFLSQVPLTPTQSTPDHSTLESLPASLQLSFPSTITSEISQASASTISRLERREEEMVLIPGIASLGICESRCCICNDPSGRCRIPNSAVYHLWLKAKIILPENNRICKKHLDGGFFNDEAFHLIEATKTNADLTGHQVRKWILFLTDKAIQKQTPVNFDSNMLTESDYKLLTGIGQQPFNDLLDVLRKSDMRDSGNRTVRNSLAMFLMLLRLGISQRVLGFLFGILNQSVVSETIESVSKILEDSFVPRFLGYEHLTREELLRHMSPMCSKILELDDGDLVLILDGTYLYIQKSTVFYIQRRTFSGQKLRNLFKAMIVCAPNGYVLHAEGLYFADGLNNDAKILEHMWSQDSSIRSILMTGDCLVLDRGFRNVISTIEDSGIKTKMPYCMEKGETQIPTAKANESRKVTKVRWVVEAVNGRLKGVFAFFRDVIPTGYFSKCNRFLKIALAIQNAYFPPLLTETDVHQRIADDIVNRDEDVNLLQQEIESSDSYKRKPAWIEATEDDVLEFPALTLEELEMISLGPYQMDIARFYNNEHLESAEYYKFFIHKEVPGLIRARLQSRFCKRNNNVLWIRFEEFVNGRQAIKGYFCLCKSGARTIGCCGHVAAVLRYLSLDRFLPRKPQDSQSSMFLDAAAMLADDSEDETEEEDNPED